MKSKLSHPKEKFKFDLESAAPIQEDPTTYIPSRELVAAIKVSFALGQPLLLTGEPGTGKTVLAHYLAKELDLGDPIIFDAQTGSSKKDLFYTYDALAHFQWSQVHRNEHKTLTKKDFEDNLNLIRYEGLGEAIRRAEKDKKQSVVLIDEIDKAPRDLPNDLLAAIENLQFEVPEILSEKVVYKCPPELRPIIIITSNSEKNLPDAFLRRIVYFHIPFPDHDELLKILAAKTKVLDGVDLEAVTSYFLKIREKKNLNKNPATAELIAWATLLGRIGFPTAKLTDTDQLNDVERDMLRTANSVLAKTKEDLHTLNIALGLSDEKGH